MRLTIRAAVLAPKIVRRSALSNDELLEIRKNKGNPTVFVQHANWTLGKPHLHEYFGKFGDIKQISMYYDEKSGLHQGFSSITFKDPKSAYSAVVTGQHVLNGQMIDLQYNIPFRISGLKRA